MEISIVVPIFNEEENIPPLHQEIVPALEGGTWNFELILVDDGSLDGSFSVAERLAGEDSRVKVVRLRRNFGQTAALAAGFDVARGDVVIALDGDLQNDPADIPRLLEKFGEGYDVVSGWRQNRRDGFFSRTLPSVLASRLISRLTNLDLHDFGCTLKAYRRKVLNEIRLYGELHRFMPVLACQVGARITEIAVNHRPRRAGKSKYGLGRTVRVILDLVTVKFLLLYSTRPLQLFGKWALWSFLLGILSGFCTLYMKWADGLNMNRNPLLILTAFLLFSGIQFIALGLLGELVTRTYHEVQEKPIYLVRETRNLS